MVKPSVYFIKVAKLVFLSVLCKHTFLWYQYEVWSNRF